MNKVLKKLLEDRAAAQVAYDEFVNPLIEAGDELTEEQETQRVELRTKVERLDARIAEVDDDDQRNSRIAEVRSRVGLDKPVTEPSPADVAVTKEPAIYDEGSPNSYFADLARSDSRSWKGHRQACDRLDRAEHQAAKEMVELERSGKKKDRRAAARIAQLLGNEFRCDDPMVARQAVDQFRALGQTGWSEVERRDGAGPRIAPDAETRGQQETRTGMTTGSSSGGSFATPVYFVEKYAPYRQFGRVFIDQANKQPLPDYGMTVYLPHLTGPAAVASQGTEGTGVTETDPTAGYLSGALTTEAGQVIVAQQLLDRAGPNFQFDVMVFDQLRRALANAVDTYALTQALAGAGSVSYAGTVFNVVQANNGTSFYSKVGQAKKSTVDAAGTVLPATHLFAIPDRWEFVEGWTDGNSRPVVVPNPAGVFQNVAWGNDGGPPVAEGYTGYKLRNLGVFEDGNIPSPGAGNDQVIVAHMDEVWIYEGDPVPRTIPQTYAQNLQVLIDLYEYITAIVRYPLAVQTINGTGMAAPTF